MQTYRTHGNTLENLVAIQVKKWETETKKRYKKPIRPVITICRLPGSGAEALAKKLSDDLRLDLFDQEIVEEIAKNAKMSKSVVESLDEQDRSALHDWIGILQNNVHLWPDEYFSHLTNVIGAIGAHGHAIIVGRGAGHILPNEVCLRLLLVAPLEVRINNLKEAYKITSEEAEKRIAKTEKDLKAFIKKYFSANMADPTNYDLTINTANFTVDVTADIVKEAFNQRKWYDYSARQ